MASSKKERSGSDSSPEPPAEDYERWVTWWWQELNMPEWWQELAEIPEVDDYWELTQMIWASFKLPQLVSKLHDVENYYLAPLAPPMSLPEEFPPAAKSPVSLLGHLRRAIGDNSGLCAGPPVLGREVQPTYPRPTMPFGGEHPGVEGSDGALHLLPQ